MMPSPVVPSPAARVTLDKRCEFCTRPLSDKKLSPVNTKRRRFCDNKCRAMKWKMDHPETWGEKGTPIAVGGDARRGKKVGKGVKEKPPLIGDDSATENDEARMHA